MAQYSAFRYKAGNSFVHRLPAWIKILFVPVCNLLIFSLPWQVAAGFVVAQTVLFCALRFSFREQCADVMPVIWYGAFLYLMGFGAAWYALARTEPFWGAAAQAAVRVAADRVTGVRVLKFFACVQSASLMFKTATSLELRAGIETIERAIRRWLPCKKEAKGAASVALLVNFIPAVFALWQQLSRAWLARGGRRSLRMVLVIIPVLFFVGLKYAADTTKAVLNRTGG